MTSVLITGASSGIGRATAIEFAERGFRVIATARDPKTLHDLTVDQRLALDVTNQTSVDAVIEAAGDIDVLVSNAGVIFHAAVEATPLDKIEKLFATNTFGALRIAQAVLPQMRQRSRGRILFLSSVAGRITRPGSGAYASTKWALEALAETLAGEVEPFGIDVGLLEPGAVSSGALDDVQRYTAPGDPYASIFRENTGREMITPEEVAAAIADAAEAQTLPLRTPVGAPAQSLLL
ncbi:MAG: SDR family oxidoreductase [Rhodococcus sp. (in: high G+C Gram-positive bacteria)]|nr:MAG: SDR family oxidoreductase [Rhodococcus sp. (in: high G+C Gram-positive bacteria)]